MDGEVADGVPGPGLIPPAAGNRPARARGRRGHRVLVGGTGSSAPSPEVSEQGPRGRARRRRMLLRGSVAEASWRSDTRERILDVALDLFVEQGYASTSLREIAEQVGVTKAALYYHFPSKEDIFRALHLRMHALMSNALERLPEPGAGRPDWAAFFDGMIDDVVAGSKLFLMHQRNAAEVSEWHAKDHAEGAQHPDEAFLGVLRDRRLALDDRVRLGGAVALIAGGASLLIEPGDAPVEHAALSAALRAALHDLLLPGVPPA